MKRPDIAAVVLAAGLSTRMAPRNKLLARMPDGGTMIGQTVDRVLGCAARPVIVVTGHQAPQVRAALAGMRIRFVDAAQYADGMASSLRAGIAALPAAAAGLLICLGDMPLVEPALLERMIAAYEPDKGHEIIVPCYNGQRGNPVLWGRRFFNELLQLSGDVGGKQIMHRHTKFISEIMAETDSVLRDFDTPASVGHGLCKESD